MGQTDSSKLPAPAAAAAKVAAVDGTVAIITMGMLRNRGHPGLVRAAVALEAGGVVAGGGAAAAAAAGRLVGCNSRICRRQ